MAIISGLAITHLIGAASLLIEQRQRVRWDWLAVVAAVYLGYLVIYGWWISFAAFHAEVAQLPFYRFLMPTLSVTFLALAARAVLPDKITDRALDLADHYHRNCRFIFGCLLICQCISAVSTVIRGRGGHAVSAALPGGITLFFAAGAVVVLLACVRRRLVHALFVPALFAATLLGSLTRVV